MKNILGISAFYHDSAAALIVNGELSAAAQEERFTRIKHDQGFPNNAIEYCLKESNLSIEEIDYVSFYEKPLLKFDRCLKLISPLPHWDFVLFFLPLLNGSRLCRT